MMQGNGGGAAAVTGLRPRTRTRTSTSTMNGEKEKARTRSKVPSPKEMVAHYESKGMQPQEASLRVIEDLQNLLVRVVTTNKSSDILLRLESKLDSKPGYPQTLAIGLVSGALPHVLASLANIWNNVRSSTSSSSP